MTYWHMQLYPGDRRSEFPPELIKEILIEKKCIGLGDWEGKKDQISPFINEMKKGDIVLIRDGGSPIALVQITGDHEYKDSIQHNFDWFENRRNVKVLDFYEGNIAFPQTRGTLQALRDTNTTSWRFIDNWYNGIKGNVEMKEIIKLLKTNKNLILTGAPGTGKTFLAKQIAESIIQENSGSQQTPLEILKKAIDSFQPDLKAREENENLLKLFLKQFPKEKIPSLTLDEYCTGKGDRNNFCWWMETGLYQLGSYAPAQRGALVYGIFYSKEFESYRKREIFNDTGDDETLNKITVSISNALEDNEKAKKEIMNKYYDAGFLLKILSSYKITEFIPIHSLSHINNIITLFSIPIPDKSDQIDKSKAIFDFYKEMVKENDITTYEFMGILYDTFNIKEGETKNEIEQIVLRGEYEFVQFHPSYDYTDFVEGLRPVRNENNNDIGFELKNGIFKEFCKKAKNNPNKNYVFIIDEINRGEISKIFGELFFSIDPGYRGDKGKVKTQYSNMQTEDTLFSDIDEDYFYVPKNVYIIGTMNDIDRSVESFDFAMRRRFVWREITAKDSQKMLISEDNQKNDIIKKHQKEIEDRMDSINKLISEMDGLGPHYQIGAAYFLRIKEYPEEPFRNLWELHLEPLLREYLRGMQGAETMLSDLRKAYDSYEG